MALTYCYICKYVQNPLGKYQDFFHKDTSILRYLLKILAKVSLKFRSWLMLTVYMCEVIIFKYTKPHKVWTFLFFIKETPTSNFV